jgi:hypothetical protein
VRTNGHLTAGGCRDFANQKITLVSLKSALIVTAACLTAAALKLELLDAPGPWVFGDELLYRLYAHRIFHGLPYVSGIIADPLYPPLYPFLLSFGYVFVDWYRAMIVMNILVAIASPVLMYAITKWFAGKRASYAAATVSAFIPSGFLYTPLLMAENLAIPMFLLALWAALRPKLCTYPHAFFVGVAVASAYVTKYALLIYVGPLMLGFTAMQWTVNPATNRIRRLIILCVAVSIGCATVLLPWIGYAHISGLSVMSALGLAGTVLPQMNIPDTTAGLWMYVSAMLAASILAVAPIAGLIASYRPRNGAERIYLGVCVLSAILTIGFTSVLSWKMDNAFHDTFNYLFQRYMVYLTWLAIPIGFAAAERIANEGSRLASASVGSTIVLVAGLTLLVGMVWPGLPGKIDVNSPDLWAYRPLIASGHAIVVVISIVLAIVATIPLFPISRSPIAIAQTAAIAVFGFLCVAGMHTVAREQIMPKIMRRASHVLSTWGALGDGAVLAIDQKRVSYYMDFYAWQLTFWTMNSPIVVAGTADFSTNDPNLTYEWPSTRYGIWASGGGKPTPKELPSSFVLFSFGLTPLGAEPIYLGETPGTSFFLMRIPPERAMRSNS